MKINTNKFLSTLIAIFAAISLVSCWGEKKNHEEAIVDHFVAMTDAMWGLVDEKKEDTVKLYNEAMKAFNNKKDDASDKLESALEDIKIRLAKQQTALNEANEDSKKAARKKLIEGLEKMKKSIEEIKK